MIVSVQCKDLERINTDETAKGKLRLRRCQKIAEIEAYMQITWTARAVFGGL